MRLNQDREKLSCN